MEKRTISELAALYELEPALKDIYVEGPTDRAFVRVIIQHLGLMDIGIYDVGSIDIPRELTEQLNLENGNRDRVIALALELDRVASVDLVRRVCCIADADDEAGSRPRTTGRILLYSDFTSIEMHAWDADALDRYFTQVTLGMPITAREALAAIEPILRRMALSRRATRSMQLNTAPVDATHDCVVHGTGVGFDDDNFTTRFLNKAGATARRAEFEAALLSHDAALGADARLWAVSEDYFDLLHWFIVQVRGPKRTVDRRHLGHVLLLAVDPDSVVAMPLVRELNRRLA